MEEASTQVTMALPPCSAANSFEGAYKKNPKSCTFKKVKGLSAKVLENYCKKLGFENSSQIGKDYLKSLKCFELIFYVYKYFSKIYLCVVFYFQ